MAPNLSIHMIPVYWVMALGPHIYAAGILKSNKTIMDNTNPRGADINAQIQKAIPSATYARWERAEAAHKNLLENSPLLIGAVIIGNVAGLDTRTMNGTIGSFLVLRAMYIALYVNITTRKASFLRSVNWAISIGVLFSVYIMAGNKLAYRGY